MITRATLSSVVQGLPKYRSMLAGNSAFIPTSFESIASVTANSGTAITFNSIPSTYSSLQIRYQVARDGGNGTLSLRFNGDTGTNYGSGYFTSVGTTRTANNDIGGSRLSYLSETGTASSDFKAIGIIDIYDYASTSKVKTIRNISGIQRSVLGSNAITFSTGIWTSTAAITSITFDQSGDIFGTSIFALYGIKGA